MRWTVLFLTLSYFVLFIFKSHSVEDLFIYSNLNFILSWLSGFAFVLAGIFYFLKRTRLFYASLCVTLLLAYFSFYPFHEVDKLFYSQLQIIEDDHSPMSMADRMDLCEHIKRDYINLKPAMLLNLEKSCSNAVLKLSLTSSQDLKKAFNWAYSEYAKKPQAIQAEALACLYAETNQKEFAVELSEKHQFGELTQRLKISGRCRSLAQRQIASTEK